MQKIAVITFSELPVFQNMGITLFNRFNSKKIESHLILTSNLDINKKEGLKENILCVKTTARPTPSYNSMCLYFKNKNKIVDYIIKHKIDKVIFISKHIWNFLLSRALSRNNVSCYHIFHDPLGHNGDKISKGVFYYNKFISRYLEGVITLSSKSYDDTKNTLKPRCKVYKVTFSDREWLPFKTTNEIRNSILMFGRINNYKGLEYIPAISKKIFDKNPHIKIVISGKASDDFNQNLLKDIEALPNIKLINEFIPEKDIDEYYYNSDFCLVLHTSITQSGVILDAYRHSKCIVCFNINGIEEFVSADSSYCINNFNVDEIVDKIIHLESDLSLLQEKNRLAWSFGKSKFSMDVMIDELIKVLELKE